MRTNKIKVFRVLLGVSPLSGPYNQFTFPFTDVQEITLVIKDKADINLPENLNVTSSNGSWKLFIKNILLKMKKNKYDVMHLHHLNIAFLVMFLAIFTRVKKPKTIFTLGTCYKNLKLKNRLMLPFVLIFFDNFVCCGQAVYDSIPKLYMELFPVKFKRIVHGINIDRLKKEEKNISEKNDSKDLLCASRLIKEKNIPSVINAFIESNVKNKLIFVGGGGLKKELEKKVCNLKLSEKILFKGIIPREKVYNLMRSSYGFVSASDSDGMPIGVLEAMYNNCLVVLSNIAPHREIVESGVNVFLFEIGDENTLVESIRRIYSLSKIEQDEILNNNRKIVESYFSTKRMMDEYEKLYVT